MVDDPDLHCGNLNGKSNKNIVLQRVSTKRVTGMEVWKTILYS
jgi:hypothetical protein